MDITVPALDAGSVEEDERMAKGVLDLGRRLNCRRGVQNVDRDDEKLSFRTDLLNSASAACSGSSLVPASTVPFTLARANARTIP